MTKVLVLGATGDQGHPLITRLLKAGLTPIAALRNPDAFQGTEFSHVETVQADLYDTQSMIGAARGIDAIAAHLPFVFDRKNAAALGNNIAAAATKNGVKKIVFNTSCFVADENNDNPAHDGRRDIEQAIIDSETAYAIFEPKVFMDNLIRGWNKPAIVNQGIFAYPAKPDLLISWICLDDVAAYMVEALTRDDIPDGRYAIGGPEALVGDQVAERLSKVAGKVITFNSLTPDQFASGMSLLVTGSAQVEPLSIYDRMAGFYRFYNGQDVSPLIADNDNINSIFRHRPASLEQWAEQQDWTDPTDPALKVRMAGLA
ncbi:MAG: NmrA family NAD(P)-binding protein [Halieaceae bacterium]|jgi:uncharacterized protein YbjT (DUF2867 family)|nr:NmrA family NAD(P)-binding protein [Halieaceae bacterium]